MKMASLSLSYTSENLPFHIAYSEEAGAADGVGGWYFWGKAT
jgi:hypothetical protein